MKMGDVQVLTVNSAADLPMLVQQLGLLFR
jgi:hypothetical protein